MASFDRSEENRILGCECKNCYYTNRIKLLAIYFSICKSCGKSMNFSNSDIDRHCIDCARELHVCKHCGKDLN